MRLRVEARSDHVYAEATGAFRRDEAATRFGEILDVARQQRLLRILIDCRLLEGAFSLMDRYSFGKLMSVAVTPGVRIALVADPRQIWPDRFLETVAGNRGVTVKVTSEIEEALDWLRQSG